MTADDFVVTRVDQLDTGMVRVRGVSTTSGPFNVTMTADQYHTGGVHDVLRVYFAHHPTRPRSG